MKNMINVGDNVACMIGPSGTPCNGIVQRVYIENDVQMVDLMIAHNGLARHLAIEATAVEMCVVKDPYVEAIEQLLETAGLEAANAANHKALETKKITMEQFQAAARVLAREILKR